VVIGFCAFLNLYAPQSLLPTLAQAFHVSKALASLTVSASTLAIALFSPICGRLVGRFSRHRLLRPALVLLSVSALSCGLSPTLTDLMAWRFVEGLALPILLAVAMAFVGQEFSGQGLGRAMAWYVAANVFGGFCGRFFCGVLGEALGWRTAFLAVGCLNLAGAWAVLRYMPDGEPTRTSSGGFLELSRQPAMRAAWFIGFNVLFALVGIFTWVTYHLADAPFSLGPAALGSIFFVYVIGGAITPMAGHWLDRVGFRPGLAAAAATVMVGAALTLLPSLGAVMVGLALVCSGAFVSQSATTSFVTQAAGPLRGTAIGVYLGCYYLGGTAGAAVPGLLWAVGGWPACVLCVLAIEAVVLVSSRSLRLAV
jgi:predicted MFS family arabinose efflux permease